ncbi:MAG TPA: hypothetical protein EYP85_12990 [Armatimonadetes bacterium]|nr:hypothetical protein [Armatimonadota bacterium]
MSAGWRIIRGGLWFSLIYLLVYNCTYAGMLFEGTFLGWASFQGQRLLNIPGHRFFAWRYGLEALFNTSPNVLAGYRIGVALVLSFVLGSVWGLLFPFFSRGLGPRGSEPADEADAQPSEARGMAIASAMLALVGTVAFGYLLGFLAVVFGSLALRRSSQGAERRWACLGQLWGVFDLVVWTIALAVQVG